MRHFHSKLDIFEEKITFFEMEPLDLTKPKERFNDFIKIPNNKRLIFSGIFGIGETYFLKDFFQKNSQYVALHIFPTNYSVARNEDIFELIKYDILYEVLKHKPALRENRTYNS